MADMAVVVRGKQLWMGDVMVAECVNEATAQIIKIALVRGKLTKVEADLFMALFPA